jgi:hypothetical protein
VIDPEILIIFVGILSLFLGSIVWKAWRGQ